MNGNKPYLLAPRGTNRGAFPCYSDAVCRTLSKIRQFHETQESALDPEERRELADALQVLALAAHLESQIAMQDRDKTGGE
jgi:hypothetical protein